MRLYSKKPLTSTFTQALVARRWQNINFDAAISVSFNPASFQQAAGLVCYYKTENWTSVQITWNEEKEGVIDIVCCDKFTFSQPIQE